MRISSKIILIFIVSVFLFSACDIPIYTKRQVRAYYDQVETIYSDSKGGLDQIAAKLNRKTNYDKNQYLGLAKEIEDQKNIIVGRKMDLDKLTPPKQAQDLQKNLDSFLAKEIEAMTISGAFFQYFGELNDVIIGIPDTENQLADTVNNLSDNADALQKRLQEFAVMVNEDQARLKAYEVDDSMVGYHTAMIDYYTSLAEFIHNLNNTSGANVKNEFYNGSARQNLDQKRNQINVELDKITKGTQINNDITAIDNLEPVIEQELQTLKAKYSL